MLLIYNLWALLVSVVIVTVGAGLHTLAPSAFQHPYQKWTIGILVAAIGGAAELLGIRGRIFFMPIWLIGVGILGYCGYAHWGVVGIVAPLGAAIFAFWWMMKSSSKREANNWTKAKETLPALKAFRGDGSTVEFWNIVKRTLFLPLIQNSTAEVISHNLEVARVVLARESKQLSSSELVAWDALECFLKKNQGKETPAALDFTLRQIVEDSIQSKTKPVKKGAVPPMIPANAR